MCECCEEINALKLLIDPKFNYEYTSRISRDCYKNKEFRGTILGERYTLNYCPTCGKKL